MTPVSVPYILFAAPTRATLAIAPRNKERSMSLIHASASSTSSADHSLQRTSVYSHTLEYIDVSSGPMPLHNSRRKLLYVEMHPDRNSNDGVCGTIRSFQMQHGAGAAVETTRQ